MFRKHGLPPRRLSVNYIMSGECSRSKRRMTLLGVGWVEERRPEGASRKLRLREE